MIEMENGKIKNKEELINRIEGFLTETVFAKLPEFAKKKIKEELEHLKEILLNSRLPKIAIIGRTASGKSSLINSIFGMKVRAVDGKGKSVTTKGEWNTYKSKYGEIEILDSRGIVDDVTKNEFKEENAAKDFFEVIKEKAPDIVIINHKASELASLEETELAVLKKMINKVSKLSGSEIPIIGVLAHIDSLFTNADGWPPTEHHHMIDIGKYTSVFKEKLKRISSSNNLLSIFPVSTLCRYDSDGKILHERSNFWGVEELVDYIINVLPEEAQLKMAVATRINSTLKKFSNKIITIFCTLSAGIALQPIPFADMPFLITIQLAMISIIGYIGRGKISASQSKDFLGAIGANVGAAFIAREALRAVLKVIPGVGNIASGAVAAGTTYALGKAAVAYFIDDYSIDDVKVIFKKNNSELKGKSFDIKKEN